MILKDYLTNGSSTNITEACTNLLDQSQPLFDLLISLLDHEDQKIRELALELYGAMRRNSSASSLDLGERNSEESNDDQETVDKPLPKPVESYQKISSDFERHGAIVRFTNLEAIKNGLLVYSGEGRICRSRYLASSYQYLQHLALAMQDYVPVGDAGQLGMSFL
ncbi:hypothetical protein L917_02938 [Phytophthora nicotianae]|uniref:Uncharacterized protein n=1 Tax=Phytophthora nicotianae TaxID=4792 RepID=W2LUI9_PHYNI|nr:hypothetical protein L917_02938 [Phytophthora nicotianae]